MLGGLWNAQIWVFLSQGVQISSRIFITKMHILTENVNKKNQEINFELSKSIFILKIQLELSGIDTYSFHNIRLVEFTL